MKLSHIYFENFRNFSSLDLSVNQGLVVLVGPNGSGKTNFLEGIYFGLSLRRFPESKFHQLFLEGKSHLRVKLTSTNFEPQTQEVFIEIRDSKHLSQHKVNNLEAPRNQYTALLPVISFLPQDLNLLTRSPGDRRRYLNETLTLVSAQYRYAKQRYEETLKQRNELLQKVASGVAKISELEVWNEQLAEHGSFICTAREIFLEYLNETLPQVLKDLTPELLGLNFVYKSSGEKTKDKFQTKLEILAAQEQRQATTLIGPHRDDFETRLKSRPAVGFISRGQLRAVTLALKIIEKQYLEARLGKIPIALLDDVFSEFDQSHQQKLITFLTSLEQVFITTTHLGEIKALLTKAQVYEVSGGVIS